MRLSFDEPVGVPLSVEIANLLAKNFIQRKDVKAVQTADGAYHPHWVSFEPPIEERERIPWRRQDLNAHLAGEATFGHYILDDKDQAKLFAFDIDLIDTGFLPTVPMPDPATLTDDSQVEAWFATFAPCNPREAWKDRKHPGREWMKFQMRMLSARLAAKVTSELGIRTAVAYSGSKGVHVYGLTGTLPAKDIRDAAEIVMDSTGDWELKKGRHFYKHRDQSIQSGFPNFSLEVYPKQDSLASKDLGNLLRLPLGRNKKSNDPCFFVDLSAPLGVMRPVDTVFALTTENPWAVVGG